MFRLGLFAVFFFLPHSMLGKIVSPADVNKLGGLESSSKLSFRMGGALASASGFELYTIQEMEIDHIFNTHSFVSATHVAEYIWSTYQKVLPKQIGVDISDPVKHKAKLLDSARKSYELCMASAPACSLEKFMLKPMILAAVIPESILDHEISIYIKGLDYHAGGFGSGSGSIFFQREGADPNDAVIKARFNVLCRKFTSEQDALKERCNSHQGRSDSGSSVREYKSVFTHGAVEGDANALIAKGGVGNIYPAYRTAFLSFNLGSFIKGNINARSKFLPGRYIANYKFDFRLG